MSRKNQQGDVTFAEAPGLESNQHAKKLAKEKSKKKDLKFESVFSQRGQKVVKVTFKPNGAYQEYVGSLAKKSESQIIKAQIVKWKKDNLWVDEHALEEYSSQKIAKLAK